MWALIGLTVCRRTRLHQPELLLYKVKSDGYKYHRRALWLDGEISPRRAAMQPCPPAQSSGLPLQLKRGECFGDTRAQPPLQTLPS
jgi:hypothetical protein